MLPLSSPSPLDDMAAQDELKYLPLPDCPGVLVQQRSVYSNKQPLTQSLYYNPPGTSLLHHMSLVN